MLEPFAALQEYNVYKSTSLDYASLNFNLTRMASIMEYDPALSLVPPVDDSL
jgi:hypothetical protein